MAYDDEDDVVDIDSVDEGKMPDGFHAMDPETGLPLPDEDLEDELEEDEDEDEMI